jgi:hypothetical protein
MKLNQPTVLQKISQVFLVIFFGISLLLGLFGSFVKRDLMPNFREERNLSKFPSFNKIFPIEQLPLSITKFAADNFGFRKQLLSMYFRFRLKVLDADVGLRSLLGHDSWLFVDGEIPLFRNQDLLGTVQAERIRQRLDAWCEYAQQNGAKFVFFVGPNKSTIYPDKLPAYLDKFRNHRSLLEQVYALEFKCPFIKIDLRDTLIRNNNELLYYKWGTHWNDRAAQLSWNHIKEQISANEPNLSWPETRTTLSYRPARPLEDSMWQWFGMDDPHTVMLPTIEMTTSPEFDTVGQRDANRARMLIFGDSFLQFMFHTARIVADDYSTWVLHAGEHFKFQSEDTKKDAWLITVLGDQWNIELMKNLKPNFVMLEVVERNILSLADLPLPLAGEHAGNPTSEFACLIDIQVNDLEGVWKAGNGIGKIEICDGSNLLVTTETGMIGAGKVNGVYIEVPSWKVTGMLTTDKKKIQWSNAVVWTR